MAFYTSDRKTLPNFVTQEEFEKIFEEIARQEKRATPTRRKRLRQYRLAVLLGFEAGMRISEIVGWPLGNIPKLEKKNVSEVSIRIFGKKGRERIVPRPKRFSDKALEMLPLQISRRALQSYIEKLGHDILNRDIGFHCVDKDTEILTDEGWKKYNEIKAGKNIFTLNVKRNVIETKPIKKIFIHNYNGEVFHIKNEYIDSLITPEHKIIVRYSTLKQRKDIWNSDEYDLISINELLSKKSLRQIKYKLSSFKNESDETIGKNIAGVLGWILSDGHISKKDDDKDKCGIISKLLSESGIKFYIKIQKEKMIVFRISKESSKLIFNYINKDRTPNLKTILNLNKTELEAIYENMMLGDGTKQISNSREYTGQNPKRIELIRILASLLNKRSMLGYKKQKGKKYFRTYIINQNTRDIHRDITKENYKGIIWCPSTDNKTFLARRNGTIYLTGNTLRHGFGSHLAGQGRPLHEIQMLMGHARLDTTGIYLHANPKVAIEGARESF